MKTTKNGLHDYFLHEVGMKDNAKLVSAACLLDVPFYQAYAIYNILLEFLTEARTHRLEMAPEFLAAISKRYEVDYEVLGRFEEAAVRAKLLAREDDEVFSPTMIEYFEGKEAKAENRRKGQEKRNAKAAEQPAEQPANEKPALKGEKTAKAKPEVPYGEIVDAYHRLLPAKPKVLKMSKSREASVAARFSEYGLDAIMEVLEFAAKDDFYSGQNGKWQGLNFDWVFNATNFLKLYEKSQAVASHTATPTRIIKVDLERLVCKDGESYRTYGDGSIKVPMDAPDRPNETAEWDGEKWTNA